MHPLPPFSSPEAAIFLVSTKNRNLLSVPIFEHAQKILSIIFNQSDLSDLTRSPWIADFRCWERPEVALLGADQKDHGLWGRECPSLMINFWAWADVLESTKHALPDVAKFTTSGCQCYHSHPFRRLRDQKKQRALGTRMPKRIFTPWPEERTDSWKARLRFLEPGNVDLRDV